MALQNYRENWQSPWSVLFNSSEDLEVIIEHVNGKYKEKEWERKSSFIG